MKCGSIIYKLTITTAGSVLLKHVALISKIVINDIAVKWPRTCLQLIFWSTTIKSTFKKLRNLFKNPISLTCQ